MIRINRANCPVSLSSGTLTASSYSRQDVKDALIIMQNGKCAYCEKKMDSEKQVDHFIPQEEFVIGRNERDQKIYDWNRANVWENLLYSCNECNGAKKKRSPFSNSGVRLILDPSHPSEYPEEHIIFITDNYQSSKISVHVRSDSQLGNTTIDALKLTRKKHIGRLQRHAIVIWSKFLGYLVEIKNGTDISDSDCTDFKDTINTFMNKNKSFSAYSKAFISQLLESDECGEIEEGINLGIQPPSVN